MKYGCLMSLGSVVCGFLIAMLIIVPLAPFEHAGQARAGGEMLGMLLYPALALVGFLGGFRLHVLRDDWMTAGCRRGVPVLIVGIGVAVVVSLFRSLIPMTQSDASLAVIATAAATAFFTVLAFLSGVLRRRSET